MILVQVMLQLDSWHRAGGGMCRTCITARHSLPSGQQLHLLSELCPCSKQQPWRYFCNALVPKYTSQGSSDVSGVVISEQNKWKRPYLACNYFHKKVVGERGGACPCVLHTLWREKARTRWDCRKLWNLWIQAASQMVEWRMFVVWACHLAWAGWDAKHGLEDVNSGLSLHLSTLKTTNQPPVHYRNSCACSPKSLPRLCLKPEKRWQKTILSTI